MLKLKIGVTGGIASGKTVAQRVFEDAGIYTIDADAVAREVVRPGSTGARLIEDAFGSEFFSGGVLNRRKLRDEVFKSPYKTALLNSLLHPLVRTELLKRLAAAGSAEIAAVFIPLLFESGSETLLDEIWTISANEETRIKRLQARDNISVESARDIISRQLTDAEREACADVTIYNNGDETEFKAEIKRLINTRIKALCKTEKA